MTPPTAGTILRMKKAGMKNTGETVTKKKLPSIKNRIRGLERFLKRPDLEDSIREAKEQQLKQLQSEFQNKSDLSSKVEAEKEFVLKYKRIRFFERRKLMRKFQQLTKKILDNKDDGDKDDDDKTRDAAALAKVENQLKYIFFYPKQESYLSLFPRKPLKSEMLRKQNELLAKATELFDMASEVQCREFQNFCVSESSSKTVKVRRDKTDLEPCPKKQRMVTVESDTNNQPPGQVSGLNTPSSSSSESESSSSSSSPTTPIKRASPRPVQEKGTTKTKDKKLTQKVAADMESSIVCVGEIEQDEFFL